MIGDQKAIARFKKKCIGLIVSWDDQDPTSKDNSNIINRKVRHVNKTRSITAKQLVQGKGKLVFHRLSFLWLIEMTGVFRYPNGTEQLETREIEGFFCIGDVNSYADDAYNDIRKHGSDEAYHITRFKVTCIGLSPKTQGGAE